MKAIIVGSGISGLTAGAYLTQQGYQVTIYEQYNSIGGVTGEIKADGFTWNMGQLLVEGFGSGEQVGNILSDLNLTDKVDLSRNDRVYSFPDFKIEKPEEYGGPYWRREMLKELFPDDSTGLDRYYKDYVRFMELMTLARRSERSSGLAALWLKIRLYLKLLPFLRKIKWNVQKLASSYFKSKKLHAVFLSILADFVTRPSESQGLGIFAVNPEPAFDKRVPLEVSSVGRQASYNYILGGCGALVETFANKIKTEGGSFKTGTAVKKLIMENNTVKGVIDDAGNEECADLVLVSGGAREFLELIGKENAADELVDHVDGLPLMESVFMVHLGIDFDPSAYQRSATTYYYNTYDFESAIDELKNGKYHEGHEGYLIYIPSMHTPGMAPAGHHAVTVYTIAPNTIGEGSWEERKEEFADKLLAEAEKSVPGLQEHTKSRVIFTPDDFKKITHLKHHAFGGVAPVMGKKGLPHRSPIKNLWFIGAQSESGAGMNNVMEGAWRTVKLINKSTV